MAMKMQSKMSTNTSVVSRNKRSKTLNLKRLGRKPRKSEGLIPIARLACVVILLFLLPFSLVAAQQPEPERNTNERNTGGSKIDSRINAIPFRLDAQSAKDSSRSENGIGQKRLSFKAGERVRVAQQANGGLPAFRPLGQGGQASSQSPTQFGATSPSFGSTSDARFGNQDVDSNYEPGTIPVLGAAVQLIDPILIPARETGVIAELSVREGDFIAAGQVFGRIDDLLFQSALEQAKLQYKIAYDKANDGSAVLAARSRFSVAKIEAAKKRKLIIDGATSDSELVIAELQEKLAEIEITKASNERTSALNEAKLRLAQLQEVEARLERHTFQCDFDAYVFEVFKRKQEFVREGDDVARVARMDRLYVQGNVDMAKATPQDLIGKPVEASINTQDGKQTFTGVVRSVGLETKGPAEIFIKAEVENRKVGDQWVLRPNMTANLKIKVK